MCVCTFSFVCVCVEYYVRSLLTAGLAKAMQISKFAIKRTIFIFKMAKCRNMGVATTGMHLIWQLSLHIHTYTHTNTCTHNHIFTHTKARYQKHTPPPTVRGRLALSLILISCLIYCNLRAFDKSCYYNQLTGNVKKGCARADTRRNGGQVY